MPRFLSRKYNFVKGPPYTRPCHDLIEDYEIDDARFQNTYDEPMRRGSITFTEKVPLNQVRSILGDDVIMLVATKYKN